MKYKALGIWHIFKTFFTHCFPLLPIVRVSQWLFEIGPGPTSQVMTLAQGKHHLNSNKPNVYLCLLQYPDFVLHLRQTCSLRMWDSHLALMARRQTEEGQMRSSVCHFSALSSTAGAAAQAQPFLVGQGQSLTISLNAPV